MENTNCEEVFRRKKKLGQNFLNDPNILNKICAAAQLQKEDHVVEIGPGKGSLTTHLAREAGSVTAIEKDERLKKILHNRLKESTNVRFIYRDVLRISFDRLSIGGEMKLVSNLPYNVSTPILFKLIDEREVFSKIVLMLQKEVAERISSSEGSKSYGSLSVLLQSYFKIKLNFKVPRRAFSPVPNVDSAVVTLDPLTEPAFAILSEKTFRTVTKHAFSSRRKTIRNSLCNFFEREITEQALKSSGIDQGRRAESLSLEEFARLSDSFHRIIQ